LEKNQIWIGNVNVLFVGINGLRKRSGNLLPVQNVKDTTGKLIIQGWGGRSRNGSA